MNASRSPITSSRSAIMLAGAALAVAVTLAYSNSFSGPFVYDDLPAIPQNPTIRQFSTAWFPPRGLTVSGRPLLNLSLALNYAISGPAVWSYHALNVLIHLLAGLVLFGLARRTLLLPALHESFRRAALPLALAIAGWWALHPLQTEAVTYVAQRTESMMGLFYLLTLYGFVRSLESPAPDRWRAVSIAACVLGMASKEVMVSAPVLVLLYDRTFVAGSFAAAWRQRRGYYLGLAATWLVLAVGLARTGVNRDGTKGFGLGLDWWAYDLTQPEAVARYLWLSLWPHPLIFNYGAFWVSSASALWLSALVVLPLLAGTAWALWRWPALGFLGAWFFALLAPSSLVPGATQMIVEHRMYLSLAALIALVVLGLWGWLGRRSFLVYGAVALALGLRTAERNEDYRSALALWGDNVAHRPTDAIGQCNYGIALVQADRLDEGIAHYQTALQLSPNYADAHYNLGIALARSGRVSAAITHYESAGRMQPNFPNAQANLGILLFQTGRAADAIGHYEKALAQSPDDAQTHCNLANALFQVGRVPEAVEHYRQAIRLQPGDADAHYNFGNTLFQAGQVPEAIAQYQEALRLRPADADTHYNLGLALEQTERSREAEAEYEQALRLRPDDAQARQALERLRTGR
jgi:tetratricopeptide (TPR) repeat protein